MKSLRFIFSDQLSACVSSLADIGKNDIIFFCEAMEEAIYVKHHPKKIAFLFSAMRHFAHDLEQKGFIVQYIKLTDRNNTNTLTSELVRAVQNFTVERVVITEPSEYRLKLMVDGWGKLINIPVEVRTDNRFLCSIDEFKTWSSNKKQLRMEYFYREMRKKYNILLEPNGNPVGGNWNYDKENRKPPTRNLTSPKRIRHKKSVILQDVIKLVKAKFADHFGDLEPFNYAITRDQALIELYDFIEHILPNFGEYQDAMVSGEPYLYHSLLSSYINVGLLLPLEICQLAEKAYLNNKAPLNAVEGFIRQILGWREYIRGIYWLKMPKYADLNYFSTKTQLPSFYWGAKTEMLCISEAVKNTKQHAYSHHIQRLMITGNFALLAGLDVKQVQKWYLEVYSDAFEWVEMPNTLGMALFGDGGIVGSKPYAASGKYIHRMSNFCDKCQYNPNDMLGEKACPFNALYWDFLARNRSKLESNHRLPYVYSTWDKFGSEKQQAIKIKAKLILDNMESGEL